MDVLVEYLQRHIDVGTSIRRWPDLAHRPDARHLWVHFRNHVYTFERPPPDWERSIESLNETQLLLALDYKNLILPDAVYTKWEDALILIRRRLQELNPNAVIAFALYSEDRSAMQFIQGLSDGSISSDRMLLPSDIGVSNA